jgi:membrane associated rhomboid family serine protease
MSDFERRVELAMPSAAKIFTPAVTAIIVLMIIGFALVHHAQEFTLGYLTLNPQTFLPVRLWQLITYSFINLCPWSLIFNGFVVLFIGSAIEREWRTRSFVVLWLVVSTICGAVWLAVNLAGGWNYIGTGTGACVYGLIATFGLVLRRQRFLALFWSVEAQHLALILIGIGLVVGIAEPITWIWVGGAAVAYFYVKLRWRLASDTGRGGGGGAGFRPGSFVDID